VSVTFVEFLLLYLLKAVEPFENKTNLSAIIASIRRHFVPDLIVGNKEREHVIYYLEGMFNGSQIRIHFRHFTCVKEIAFGLVLQWQ
jgi:hypothetical protein